MEALREDRRLYTVSSSLLRHALPFCRNEEIRAFGFIAAYLSDFPPALRTAARRYYSFEKGLPSILYVGHGSPAERAGLRVGDVIFRVEGGELKPMSPLGRRLASADNGTRRTVISTRRHGIVTPHRLRAEPSCNVPIKIMDSADINAWADGDGVRITTAMLRFTRSDSELAMVIGHELSHVLLHHTGSFLSLVAPKRLEEEADRGGLFLMARANYSLAASVRVLHRLAETHPGNGAPRRHLDMLHRLQMIEGMIDDIHRRERSGRPLLPEF